MSKCKICRTEYVKRNAWQKVCGVVECAVEYASKDKQAKITKAARVERKADKVKLDAMATKPQLTQIAQKAFNAYIRARDYGQPCISCNTPIQWGAGATGGVCDAGHYLSVGARVNLRFEPLNCHAQCKRCNNQLAGNAVNYRIGLIKKIGLKSVEFLECDHTPKKYSKQDLIGIVGEYKIKLKQLLADKKQITNY